MARIIYLGERNQYETLVSDEDYDFLIQWKWNFKKSDRKFGQLIYARRGGGREFDGELRPTILMHNVIMERQGIIRPSELHTVDHINVNSLDNQRHNLRWATKSEQNKNQKRFRTNGLATISIGPEHTLCLERPQYETGRDIDSLPVVW